MISSEEGRRSVFRSGFVKAFCIGDSEADDWILCLLLIVNAPFMVGVATDMITRKPHVIITFE